MLRYQKKPLLSRVKLSAEESIAFFQQFATLLSAGIPILQCCDILAKTQTSQAFQQVMAYCKKEITAGNYLSTCLKQFPRTFDAIAYHLTVMGEQTGTLDKTLQRISFYQEKSLQFKRQLLRALFYPAVVMITALIVTLLMLTLIVPRFEALFNNMHTPLPHFTQAVVTLSQFLRQQAWLCWLLIPVGCLLKYYFTISLAFKQKIEALLLRFPYLKTIIPKIMAARFSRHFATLFAAGIPITEAFKILAPMMGNHFYTQALLSVQRDINYGLSLHASLQKNSLFPPLMTQMIKIGEESGTLEIMLMKCATQYEAEFEYWMSHLSQLLEPLIMIILGVLIGGLVIAMYLPIFKLGTII